MAHVYANRPSGRTVVGRAIDRRLLRRRTCVAFRDIRALAEHAVFDALRAERRPAARRRRPRRRAGAVPALGADPPARAPAPSSPTPIPRRSPPPAATPRRSASPSACSSCRPTRSIATRCSALRPSPDVVVELGLYGIYHDDALIERHLHDLAAIVAPSQIVFNVQTRNPEIEHIARVWVNHEGGRCVWRLRPVEQMLEWARDAGYEPAAVEADRFDIYRVVRLVREDEAA